MSGTNLFWMVRECFDLIIPQFNTLKCGGKLAFLYLKFWSHPELSLNRLQKIILVDIALTLRVMAKRDKIPLLLHKFMERMIVYSMQKFECFRCLSCIGKNVIFFFLMSCYYKCKAKYNKFLKHFCQFRKFTLKNS